MNTVIENILTRRSCRSFTDKPVAREDIELLLKCARYAPSARNFRTWQFTAVMNAELIKKLASAMGAALDNPEYNLYCPAALIIPSNSPEAMFGREDNAVAMQNVNLAAHSIGLATGWVNQLFSTCNDAGVRAVLTEMGIPEAHVVYGMVVLGYAACELPEPDKSCVTSIVE